MGLAIRGRVRLGFGLEGIHSAAGPGLHRVAPRAWRPLHARRPRRAREGCHRATERQRPAAPSPLAQRRSAAKEDVVDGQQHAARDEWREQRRVRVARRIAGLLTHQGHDPRDLSRHRLLESNWTNPRRRLTHPSWGDTGEDWVCRTRGRRLVRAQRVGVHHASGRGPARP